LRASIDGGPVSMGEVLSVLPFQNTVATFQLKGSDIVAALENGLGQIEEGAGRFPQVSGMKYSFDKSKPPGSRVVSVEVKEGDAFVPLDPAKTYGVVSNNYMRSGGDGYSVFAKAGMNAYDFGPNLELVVADYLAANRPYKPYTDGRITEVAAATVVETPATAETATSTEAKPATSETATSTDAAAKSVEGAATTGEAASGSATTTTATGSEATTTASDTAAATTAGGKHVIARGDTLWDLAKAAYGDGTLWRKIAEANNNPRPRALHIGTELSIPSK
ncbi:MAG: 5'-nucleotidase C-terminal domain-containing protein, partial [Shinella sp.]